jgi:hypothetical protein
VFSKVLVTQYCVVFCGPFVLVFEGGGELRWNKMINKESLTQLLNPIGKLQKYMQYR